MKCFWRALANAVPRHAQTMCQTSGFRTSYTLCPSVQSFTNEDDSWDSNVDIAAKRLTSSSKQAGLQQGADVQQEMFANASSIANGSSTHSLAIVHPSAIISEDVVISPFCTVGPGVKLGRGCILHPNSHVHGRTELGERCILHTGAVVGADLPGSTILGKENLIGHYAVIGVKCQDLKYKEGDSCDLYIGNGNDIREYVGIHRSSHSRDQTVVGDRNLIMGSCHIAHDCKLGNHNILANGTMLGGHVIIQDHVHTGGAVAVHQKCQIDSYSFVAGGSMVCRDVPMYMMVAGDRAELRGLNLEGLKRHGFSDKEVRSIRAAYQKLFMTPIGTLEERLSLLELKEELMAVPAVGLMLNSIRRCLEDNRRGICSFRNWTFS